MSFPKIRELRTSGTLAYDSADAKNSYLWNFTEPPPWTTGRLEGALSFDGVDDYINVGDPADGSLDFGTNSFSYGMWVYVSSPAGLWDMSFYKGRSSAGYAGYDIELGTESWSTSIGDGNNDGSTADNPVSSYLIWDSTGLLNQWVHLFVVVDRSSNTLRAYRNGELSDVDDISSVASVSSSIEAKIGNSGSGSYPFRGKIDDVRFYDRALSAS